MATSRFHWGIVFFLACLGGCAFTPAPVLLIEKPSQQGQAAPTGLKVAVIVRDSRPDVIQKAHLCGTKRNGYMMPTSFAFLAHPETYDKIVAFHIKRILERSGYEVVAALPAIPEQLSPDQVDEKALDRPAIQTGREELRKESAPSEVKDGGELQVSDLEDREDASSWSGLKDTGKIDAIVDVKLTSLNSDFVQGIVTVFTLGWCKAKIAVCNPTENARTVVWGKSYSGFGTSGPRVVVDDTCYTMALNMAYWIMLEDLEKQVRSQEFQTLIRSAKR